MAVDEEDDDNPCGPNEDLGAIPAVQTPSRDVIMGSGGLEVSDEDDEEEDNEDSDECEDQTGSSEDDDSGRSGDDEEGEHDYGYATP